jgi:hypothetical protein
MQAAQHGASFPLAKKLRASMTPEQLAAFSKYEGESYAYDHRTRNNLKQNRGR